MRIDKWEYVAQMSVEEFEWRTSRNALIDGFLEEVVFGERV